MQQFAPEEIGARIAQARREADGMTQETLAEALDLSVRQIQNIEAGTIPWKHFSRLEAIFEKPLSWFLHGEEDPPAHLGPLEAQVAEVLSAVEKLTELTEGLDARVEQLGARLSRRRTP